MAKKKTSKKLCPNFDYFFEPVLNALNMLGGSGSNVEICKKVLAITMYKTIPTNLTLRPEVSGIHQCKDKHFLDTIQFF